MNETGEALPGAAERTKAYTGGVLVLLMLLNALNYVDRQIITVLAIPIKQDLGLTNTQIGLMSGLAFAIFYAVTGLPLAWAADRWNRVTVLSVSLAVWSGMTALCGAAQNFAQLFAARVGVGIGEAGCTPPAHSLISDLVSPARRASALSFYALGIPVGSFIGLALGGYVAQAFGWKAAFMIVGLPGIALAFVLPLLIREPRRSQTRPDRIPSTREFFRDIAGKPSYWHFCAACSLTSLLNFGSGYFLGFFFNVKHGLSLGDIGILLGIMLGIGWMLGISLGGYLSDRFLSRSRAAYALVPATALVVGVPFAVLGYWVDDPIRALALLVVPTALNSFVFGPGYAVVQGVAAPRSRAFAIAVFLMIANLIGLGLGPVIVGGLTDWLGAYFAGGADCSGAGVCQAADALARQWALIGVSLFALWAALHLFLAARSVDRDMVG